MEGLMVLLDWQLGRPIVVAKAGRRVDGHGIHQR
jgi:hypothetical protein